MWFCNFYNLYLTLLGLLVKCRLWEKLLNTTLEENIWKSPMFLKDIFNKKLEQNPKKVK